MSDDKLRVLSLQVRDVLGAREFAMEAGAVTVLSGRNGTGKSTAIEAIRSAVGGGNLAKLARVGDEGEEVDPEIVLVLDSESGQQFRVEKSAKKTRVRQQVGDSAGFEDVPSPQRWLSSLYDGSLANPITFLNAADKERVIMLLGALPVELDHERLFKAMGITADDLDPVPAGLHPLQELALIRESVFRERTGVNRDAKQKVASAEQTRRAAPAVLPDSYADEIKALEKTISAEDERIAVQIEAASNEAKIGAERIKTAAASDSKQQRDQSKAAANKRLAEVKAEADKRRAELEAELAEVQRAAEAEIAEDRLAVEQLIAGKDKIVHEEIDKLHALRDERIGACYDQQRAVEAQKVQLAKMRELAEESVKACTLIEQADQFEKEAEVLVEKSERLTAALDALDAYRREMADNLPISGLEVDGKEIKVDGVPFDQLNTARRIEIAVKVACLRARDRRLPLVWVDGAEALDAENFSALKSALVAEGVQAFIGRVEDTDLEVVAE